MAVELKKKGDKINLEKSENRSLGEVLINLNWNQGSPQKKKGVFGSIFGKDNSNSGIDLDLGCLFEMKDGSKSVIQALGNCFGDLVRLPYISLDGDDRTGESLGGENLRINGNMVHLFKRILVFTFIYDGVANWHEVDGIVTIKAPGSSNVIV